VDRQRLGLPVNLILFSFVAGITTTAAYAVYHEALLHPDEISARFDNLFLALLAALTFAVATLGINVVANFVSPAFDFANVFPSKIDFKKGGYIAALIALVLYPFAPWQGSAATFVGVIGATMGPVFGVIMVDYYLIRNGEVDVPELYREEGAYRYTNGWNVNAVAAAAIGAVFSSVLPNFTNVLPSWWGVYGWVFRGGDRRRGLLRPRQGPRSAGSSCRPRRLIQSSRVGSVELEAADGGISRSRSCCLRAPGSKAARAMLRGRHERDFFDRALT
jgi:NCS1 nucleoside transporter family